MATEFGVTNAGFVRKRLADILTGYQTAFSNITDPESGESLVVDLSDENDPLVLAINSFSDSLAVVWETLEACHNQFDPRKSFGAGLAGLVQVNGLTKKDGTPSTVTLTLSGIAGTVLAVGRQVSTLDGSAVFTLPAATLDEFGSATVIATCTVDGPTEALAGTVVKILTPVNGWNSVTNALDASIGTAEETDTALRARQEVSTALPAQSIVESIYSGLMDIEGVTFVRVYQNLTLATDARGIPAKSIAVIIVGGANADIAEVLFNRVPAGVSTYGIETETVYDEQSFAYDMKFTRPTEVPIYVFMELNIIDANLWPDNGGDLIKAAILTYAAQGALGLTIETGFDRNGYPPGESVYASGLYTPVNSVPGTEIVSLTVDFDTSDSIAAGTSVTIEWNEVATFDAANIYITVN